MSPPADSGARAERHLLHTSRHASPRLEVARRGERRTHRRLTAEHRHLPPWRRETDAGFSTAELLGNAALGIAALVAIWVVLEALGVSVVAWIGAQIGVSG